MFVRMVKIGYIDIGEYPLILAPMEDVSDPPFRIACKKLGADLMFTEFISSEGLIRDASKSLKKLDFDEAERPIGVQIFGGDEIALEDAARIVAEAHPDLLDINFGCPVKKVVCKGAGAGVLKDLDKMVKLTKRVVDAVSLPVTVKTRLGWDDTSIHIEEAAERLQDVGIAALTIHARTRAQMYKGQADWSYIAKVKNNPRIHIPIFGNGDIDSPQKALAYRNRFGADGIMIGRAAIGNPWIFKQIKHYFQTGDVLPPPDIEERIFVVREHLNRSIQWKGERVGMLEMRSHYANYFKGLPDFKSFRMRLVSSDTRTEMEDVFFEILQHYSQ